MSKLKQWVSSFTRVCFMLHNLTGSHTADWPPLQISYKFVPTLNSLTRSDHFLSRYTSSYWSHFNISSQQCGGWFSGVVLNFETVFTLLFYIYIFFFLTWKKLMKKILCILRNNSFTGACLNFCLCYLGIRNDSNIILRNIFQTQIW